MGHKVQGGKQRMCFLFNKETQFYSKFSLLELIAEEELNTIEEGPAILHYLSRSWKFRAEVKRPRGVPQLNTLHAQFPLYP